MLRQLPTIPWEKTLGYVYRWGYGSLHMFDWMKMATSSLGFGNQERERGGMLRRHSWHFSVRPSTNWKGSSAGIQVTTPIAEWAPHQGNTKEHFYSSLHIIYSKPQRKIAFGWVLSIATCFGRITFTFVASCSMQAAKETCFFCFENVIYKKSS